MNILRTLCLLVTFSTSIAQITDFLRVEGRNAVNEQNEIVPLRGINFDAEFWAWDWDTTRHNNYADASDIRFMDSLGANVIRLCLNYQYFESADGFNFIDNYLSWCDTSGIYVLLDMHVVPLGNDIFFNSIAQRQLIDTWQAIAGEYRDREVVLGYDLMNEPGPADSSLWYDFANRLIDSIRVVDSTHIIMIENTLGGEVFEIIDEPNIIYSYHDYSPFVVTHAAADWAGDSPVPTDYGYPGEVLSGTNWVTYSEDQFYWNTNSPNWRNWDSGNLIVPPGVEFAYVKPNVHGNVGTVYYDDFAAAKNGVSEVVYNADVETASWVRPGQPANWSFYTSGSHTGTWASVAHDGSRSLSISGTSDGWGVWGQDGWILIEPLIRVTPGDTLRATAWILANNINGGGVSVGFDYLSGNYELYNRQHLRDDIARYVNWSAENNKAIWCGEFGCMSAAPGNSQETLVRDKVAVMNEQEIGWAMWSYRAYQPPSFSPRYGDSVDVPLTNVLTQGYAGELWPESVVDLTIAHEGADVVLRWSPLDGAVSYTVFASLESTTDLQQYTIVGTTADSTFVQAGGIAAPRQFYVVVADY
ncbi:MAG: cellulase family glycosylhydrolase [bacterium]|nr:cellulase family glycosylhydrolase [bacterium]